MMQHIGAAIALLLLYGAVARLDGAQAEREALWRQDYYRRLAACDPQRNAAPAPVRACLEMQR